MKANETSIVLGSTLPTGCLGTRIELAQLQIIIASPKQELKARESAPSVARIIMIGDWLKIHAHWLRAQKLGLDAVFTSG
ncbi:hypothetical protein F4680DRAFT_430599 [Xylaria scruposa]|nr:hypothetical protein F4680DRAFT_430599 [Xylaria scruposa]